AGRQPFQRACLSSAYPCRVAPGLLTRIIAAMVMPRKMSSDTMRLPRGATAAASVGCGSAAMMMVPCGALVRLCLDAALDHLRDALHLGRRQDRVRLGAAQKRAEKRSDRHEL